MLESDKAKVMNQIRSVSINLDRLLTEGRKKSWMMFTAWYHLDELKQSNTTYLCGNKYRKLYWTNIYTKFKKVITSVRVQDQGPGGNRERNGNGD